MDPGTAVRVRVVVTERDPQSTDVETIMMSIGSKANTARTDTGMTAHTMSIDPKGSSIGMFMAVTTMSTGAKGNITGIYMTVPMMNTGAKENTTCTRMTAPTANIRAKESKMAIGAKANTTARMMNVHLEIITVTRSVLMGPSKRRRGTTFGQTGRVGCLNGRSKMSEANFSNLLHGYAPSSYISCLLGQAAVYF